MLLQVSVPLLLSVSPPTSAIRAVLPVARYNGADLDCSQHDHLDLQYNQRGGRIVRG